jgi:hypothetical protein
MKRWITVAAAASWGVAATVAMSAAPALADDGTGTDPSSSTSPTAAPSDTATPTPTPSSTPNPSTTGCATGALPAIVQGQPTALKAGAAGGDYVWHDSHGWHVAVTHANSKRMVFTGTIRATKPMTYARVRDERNDKVRLSDDKLTLTFRFVNYGHIDGVDIGADCARVVRFGFRVDGSSVPRTHVYLGSHGRHPTSDPFAVERA